MLPKVNGARRVRYKDDEKYLLAKETALHIFTNVDNIEDYPDGSLLMIDSADGVKYGICASSDTLDSCISTMKATLSENKNPSRKRYVICNPYHFTPLLVTAADLILNNYDIMDDDYIKYIANAGESNVNMLEYFEVCKAAHNFLRIYTALNILRHGIPDYAEAHGDDYRETRYITAWGEGEEKAGVLHSQPVSNEPKAYAGSYRNSRILYRALNSADWHDIPYIRLIDEILKNGELAEIVMRYGVPI